MDLNIKMLATGQRFLVVAALLLGGLAFSSQFSYADPSEKKAGFVLISEADFVIWAKENPDIKYEEEEPESYEIRKFTPVENAPIIIILAPGVTGGEVEEFLAPIDFIMMFEPQGEATIDLESIKIDYRKWGWHDITKRILEHAEITEEGIRALKAEVPKGKHKMRLKVKDSLGREARAEIIFRITS